MEAAPFPMGGEHFAPPRRPNPSGSRGTNRIIPLTIMEVAAAACLFLLTNCATLKAEQKTLYEQPSPYGLILVTEDKPGFRTLYFERGGALQSVVKLGDPDHLELPYAKAMLSGLALCEAPRRILIVGLGGGTLAKFLHKHYPQAVIDAVDIDPDVIKVARQFFEFREDDNLQAHVSDGRKFIEDRPGVYDLIFLDAFGTDSTPYHLTTREFFLAVKKALTPAGVALGNIWKRSYNTLYDPMIRTYLNVFDELSALGKDDWLATLPSSKLSNFPNTPLICLAVASIIAMAGTSPPLHI